MFDWKNFLRVAYLSLIRLDRWTVPRRAKTYLARLFFLIFGLVFELFNAFCFLLDNLFFPDWRCHAIKRPVFIIGPPRSGTTFLHRLLALDNKTFYCFRTWEIIFPAVIQKRVMRWLNALTGNRVAAVFRRLEQSLFKEFNKMHPVGLFEPEEDDYLFLHIFSGHDLIWIFPFPELEAYLRFDERLSKADRERIMRFYRRCIQRQGYYLQHHGTYLSKAPASSARIRSLLETFPDAKILYLVRNPLEVIPSMINLAHHVWKKVAGMEGDFPLQEQIYDTLKYYYTYPISFAKQNPQADLVFVSYEELVSKPKDVVHKIYESLGLSMSEAFSRQLEAEDAKARGYTSRHKYDLDSMLIGRERILEDLGDIFEQFNMATSERRSVGVG
ncbi:sulfotransferase [Desulfosoma sp.]